MSYSEISVIDLTTPKEGVFRIVKDRFFIYTRYHAIVCYDGKPLYHKSREAAERLWGGLLEHYDKATIISIKLAYIPVDNKDFQ